MYKYRLKNFYFYGFLNFIYGNKYICSNYIRKAVLIKYTTLIEVQERNLILLLNDEQITFDVYKSIRDTISSNVLPSFTINCR